LQKPEVYLTFDLERDYLGTGSYVSPSSFEGIRHHVPRILDVMHEHHAAGTFFLTPEVIENCEDMLSDVDKRHAVGLHSHAYYQPIFKGWERDGDSFKNYTRHEKKGMILRDISRYEDHFGHPRLFRIARLEPDHDVLKVISESGCPYDSSYHSSSYHVFQKMRVALLYRFREVPVDFHLYGLELSQMLKRDRSVVLVHPITPPRRGNPDVYNEHRLVQVIESSPEQCRLERLDHL
jgi:peptidoglycan/xylan/chitin deacetylase (PgdA/CDA1 family)